MGEQLVGEGGGIEERRRFTKCLLNDIRALEMLLERGKIESGVRRIGAEQEVFLVSRNWHPAPRAMEVLKEIDDPDFTTELASFNLEFNLPPLEFGGDCLSRLEKYLSTYLEKLRLAAERLDMEVALTGILPSLTKADMRLDNMTPRARYRSLNDAMSRLRGEDYEFRIQGVDELVARHDNVMLESCNTSFQLHFQVGPEEFAKLYNVAQLATAPLMAACTNSPLLFGKRLWRETRIALFQQAIDTRQATSDIRESMARVSFGTQWVRESALEIFREDIARFRVLLGAEIDEDPFEMIERGVPPRLKALCLHNGTVYRWNRPCYGVNDGIAHLRIENRVIPAGPSVLDAVANAAFYYGLMCGLAAEYTDVSQKMEFSNVQNNFLAAAQNGLSAQLIWFDGKPTPSQDLICRQLIPLAREGLIDRGIDSDDADRYLEIICRRVSTCKTGSQWLLDSLASLKDNGIKGERMAALTAATVNRQKKGLPVHEWELARLEEAGGWKPNYMRVEQFMTTDLFTVTEEDSVELVANLMDWERIRHVPVEDNRHQLVGLISYRGLLKFFSRHFSQTNHTSVPVTKIMKASPITVPPETTTVEAMKIMKKHSIGCLPVVKNGRLVGVVTERDFMAIARDLLDQSLREM